MFNFFSIRNCFTRLLIHFLLLVLRRCLPYFVGGAKPNGTRGPSDLSGFLIGAPFSSSSSRQRRKNWTKTIELPTSFGHLGTTDSAKRLKQSMFTHHLYVCLYLSLYVCLFVRPSACLSVSVCLCCRLSAFSGHRQRLYTVSSFPFLFPINGRKILFVTFTFSCQFITLEMILFSNV